MGKPRGMKIDVPSNKPIEGDGVSLGATTQSPVSPGTGKVPSTPDGAVSPSTAKVVPDTPVKSSGSVKKAQPQASSEQPGYMRATASSAAKQAASLASKESESNKVKPKKSATATPKESQPKGKEASDDIALAPQAPSTTGQVKPDEPSKAPESESSATLVADNFDTQKQVNASVTGNSQQSHMKRESAVGAKSKEQEFLNQYAKDEESLANLREKRAKAYGAWEDLHKQKDEAYKHAQKTGVNEMSVERRAEMLPKMRALERTILDLDRIIMASEAKLDFHNVDTIKIIDDDSHVVKLHLADENNRVVAENVKMQFLQEERKRDNDLQEVEKRLEELRAELQKPQTQILSHDKDLASSSQKNQERIAELNKQIMVCEDEFARLTRDVVKHNFVRKDSPDEGMDKGCVIHLHAAQTVVFRDKLDPSELPSRAPKARAQQERLCEPDLVSLAASNTNTLSAEAAQIRDLQKHEGGYETIDKAPPKAVVIDEGGKEEEEREERMRGPGMS